MRAKIGGDIMEVLPIPNYNQNRHGIRKYIPFLKKDGGQGEKKFSRKFVFAYSIFWAFFLLGVLPFIFCLIASDITANGFISALQFFVIAFYAGPFIGFVYSAVLERNIDISPSNDKTKVRFVDCLFGFGTATWYLGMFIQDWFDINMALAILLQFIVFDFFIERNCKAQDAKEYAELCEDKFGITIRDKDNLKTVDEAKRLVSDIIANLNAR